jgi:L-threonylcarbamoyladenylate synthase
MKITQTLSINDPQAIQTAKQVLHDQGIIVFPTDTIYGIGCNAFDPEGINKLYEIKQRPEDKALPVLIGETSQLNDLVLYVSERVQHIAKAFWPGALTLVLPKGPDVPPELSPYPTIGVRMPNLDFTLRLLRQTGPLATTSANLSGGPNPTTVKDVQDQLGSGPDLILDGGPTPGPTASTVLDLSGPEVKLLREGPISLIDIQSHLEQLNP